jgi:hypothetical protein
VQCRVERQHLLGQCHLRRVRTPSKEGEGLRVPVDVGMASTRASGHVESNSWSWLDGCRPTQVRG